MICESPAFVVVTFPEVAKRIEAERVAFFSKKKYKDTFVAVGTNLLFYEIKVLEFCTHSVIASEDEKSACLNRFGRIVFN